MIGLVSHCQMLWAILLYCYLSLKPRSAAYASHSSHSASQQAMLRKQNKTVLTFGLSSMK